MIILTNYQKCKYKTKGLFQTKFLSKSGNKFNSNQMNFCLPYLINIRFSMNLVQKNALKRKEMQDFQIMLLLVSSPQNLHQIKIKPNLGEIKKKKKKIKIKENFNHQECLVLSQKSLMTIIKNSIIIWNSILLVYRIFLGELCLIYK